MRISCGVIRDLMPLYAEGMACKDTEELVSDHIQQCTACRKVLEEMRKPADFCCEEDLGAIREVKGQLHRRKVLTAVLALLLTATVLLGLLFYLTTPEYLSAAEAIEQVNASMEDGMLQIRFTDAVDNYETEYVWDVETGEKSLKIIAWQYKWKTLLGMSGEHRAIPITLTAETVETWYSSTENGVDDKLLWGEANQMNVRTLPRLVMAYYFYLSFIAAALFTVAAVCLRKKKIGKWFALGAVFFWSFDVAAIVCGGGSLVSYSAVRHFICAIIETVLMTGSVIVLRKVVESKSTL